MFAMVFNTDTQQFVVGKIGANGKFQPDKNGKFAPKQIVTAGQKLVRLEMGARNATQKRAFTDMGASVDDDGGILLVAESEVERITDIFNPIPVSVEKLGIGRFCVTLNVSESMDVDKKDEQHLEMEQIASNRAKFSSWESGNVAHSIIVTENTK